jgi:predicted small metal-binding protein
MRVTECNHCGELISAADGRELADRVRRHYDDRHPEAHPSEDDLQEVIASSYEATDS